MSCSHTSIKCVICNVEAHVPVSTVLDLWENLYAYSNTTGQIEEVPCELTREPQPGWRLGKFRGPQGWAYNPVCEKCAAEPVIPYLEGFTPKAITV